ncbi:MAG: YgiQ family radical SAM protein [Clostridia bacterium]|nr:YgiQ family radical SAM protein [Clostridia bacterium]
MAQFLPLTRTEMEARGWDAPDFIQVTGDAYVDHPSFGVSIITRLLEDAGYRVAILAQPDYKSCEAFRTFGRPRLGFLVTAGNIDSMVAHYTAAKKKRSYDYYSPGGRAGLRPDRATVVYCNRIREAYGDVPIILGGLEASLRRFAHYDYWTDKVRRSILVDARADLLTYGMAEKSVLRIAELLAKGVPVKKIRDVRGTVYLCSPEDKLHYPLAEGGEFDYNLLKTDKKAYADAFGVQYRNQDAVSGQAIVEHYDNKLLVQNPPMPPLEREELDRVYALPYMRTYHPAYEAAGGVPAIEEVRFSITHNRGCFGACNFCALAFHQGRTVRSRSIESVVEEAKKIAALPDFKGYIHDVGGPTANFRYPACDKQLTDGVCTHRKCLAPKPCPNLKVDHREYINLIEQVEAVPGVKRVFIRSGIRFDYLMADKSDAFFRKLVRDNVSGQLKVAPEHCSADVLRCMGKPEYSVYSAFRTKYFDLCAAVGKEQYLVPYLMSSHPGSTINDAIELALCLKREGYAPEQVQDFYPTPGTASTVMYYTGINPLTGKAVYVATDYHEKQMQRALLQYNRPQSADLVREALTLCGRTDLIGFGKNCLVSPAREGAAPAAAGKPSYRGGKADKSVGKAAGRPAGKSGAKPSGRPTKQNGKPSGKGGKRAAGRGAKPAGKTGSAAPRKRGK